MRILMLTWEFTPYIVGGLGRHVTGLANALGDIQLPQRELELHVVTPSMGSAPSYELHDNKVHVHRVPFVTSTSGDLYDNTVQCNSHIVDAAQQLAAEVPFDLIHVHDWLPAQAGMELMELWRVPLLATIHATESGRHHGNLHSPLSQKIHSMEERLCHQAWNVIVCSYFMRDSLMHMFQLPEEHFHVIPNGIQWEPFAYCSLELQQQLEAQFKPYGEFLLLFIGRPAPEKGLHILLDSLPSILAQYPHARLVVVGQDSHLWYDTIVQRGLEHAVSLLGFVDDMKRNCLLKIADAAVFPSLYEPFGIVALEAMAAECPVIVSSVGGLNEVVEHEKTGLTVYPNDPNSIFWAVDQILMHPVPTRRRAKRAFFLVRDQFNWLRITKRTLYVYDHLIDYNTRKQW